MSMVSVVGGLARRLRRAMQSRHGERESVFEDIFKSNHWGDEESLSGTGSNLQQTRVIRRELPAILARHGVHTMVDAPCGDYHWMSHANLQLDSYVGVDLVPELVRRNNERYRSDTVQFQQGDLVRDALPRADLVFCRDCLVHLTFADVLAALRNMRATGTQYLLTTTFTRDSENVDIRNGDWRTLNLTLAPFNFPQPLDLLLEECTEWDGKYADKTLGLWRFSDLPL